MSKINFDSTSFGNVVVNGKRYLCDIFVFADGRIEKRDRRIAMFGSHAFTLDETRPLVEDAKILVVGTGQFGIRITSGRKHYGSAALTPRARKLCRTKRVQVIEMKTPLALQKFNEVKGKKAAMIHVAC